MVTVDEVEFRRELEAENGQVWNTAEMRRDYEVSGFSIGCVVVRRKSDDKLGTLLFTHMPRFYYGFKEHLDG